nr:hypothetical protein [Tanacetum cinerariifolium]
ESEGENGCDVPSCFTTFSNILFDADYEFDSVDDQSLHNEDFSEKIFSIPSNAEIESFSPSPIPDKKDSDSFMKEINLFVTPDDPMPPSIKDDEDSEGDILFERLLHDDPIPLPDTLDFSYEVTIFLPFFTYPVTSPVLLSSRSEDKIFNPGITVNRSYSF